MFKSKIFLITIATTILLIVVAHISFRSSWKFREDRPIKIFWVNSYASDYPPIVKKYLKGFTEVFDKANIKIEIKQFNMDTIRQTSHTYIQKTALEAKKIIDEYKPDLIFATDDSAQEYIIEPYYFNVDIPVVFAGVNKDPIVYGYNESKNIAGVLEREYIEDALEFLRKLFPYAKKVAIISEPTDQWVTALDKVENQLNLSGFEVVGRENPGSFEKFQERVLYYQDKADAFFLTPLQRFVDEKGKHIDVGFAGKWYVENSNIPEITLWGGGEEGMLATVEISYFGQGKEAGEIAKGILIDGKNPNSFSMGFLNASVRYLNLARAEMLGLERNDIPSSILINSIVIDNFLWQK